MLSVLKESNFMTYQSDAMQIIGVMGNRWLAYDQAFRHKTAYELILPILLAWLCQKECCLPNLLEDSWMTKLIILRVGTPSLMICLKSPIGS